jgi:hypothetical protein
MLYEIQPYTGCAAFLNFNATDGYKYTQGKIPGKHLGGAVKKEMKQLLWYV